MKRRRLRLLISVVLSALGGAAAVSAPRAQDCVRIESVPEHSTLTVSSDASVTSTAPATFCSLEAGKSYYLTVSRGSYEQRTLKFAYNGVSSRPDFSGIRLRKLGRSLLIPGWGQFSMGYDSRGAEALVFAGASAFKTKQAYEDYREVKDEYDAYMTLAEQARDQQTKTFAAERMVKTAKAANALRTHCWFTAAVSGWVYAGSLFETLLLAAPPRTTSAGDNAFTVEIPRRSRARAAFRSFLFPGMGQKYYGNELKGLFFQSAFVVLAYYSLDAKMHYDLATAEYELAYARFDESRQSGSVPEIAALQVDARKKFDIMDNRRTDMYTYAVSAGAIWFLNVLDAIVFGGAGEIPDRFEFETSYESSTVRTGMRINF